MKQIPVYKPKWLGSLYLLLIPIFAVIYWLNPTFWREPLTFMQSMYFSVITITTLGYGDIAPITEVARFFTAIEALSGIVLIGLFLNSVAHTRAKSEEEKRHEKVQAHLGAQYKEFRKSVINICLRAHSRGYKYDHELAGRLNDMLAFREYFNENNKERWYSVLNSLQQDERILEDLFVEIDLLVQQVTYALNNIYVANEKELRILTRLCQHTYRLRKADVYADDPAKYIGGFVWEIMAGWSMEGYRNYDIIEDSIAKI